MCADLRQLARRRLQRPEVRCAVSLPSVMQFLLQRWRAELSCAIVMGDTSVFLDSLCEGAQEIGRADLARVETGVYDLQSYRLGSGGGGRGAGGGSWGGGTGGSGGARQGEGGRGGRSLSICVGKFQDVSGHGRVAHVDPPTIAEHPTSARGALSVKARVHGSGAGQRHAEGKDGAGVRPDRRGGVLKTAAAETLPGIGAPQCRPGWPCRRRCRRCTPDPSDGHHGNDFGGGIAAPRPWAKSSLRRGPWGGWKGVRCAPSVTQDVDFARSTYAPVASAEGVTVGTIVVSGDIRGGAVVVATTVAVAVSAITAGFIADGNGRSGCGETRVPVFDSRDGPVRCTGGVLTTTVVPVLVAASITVLQHRGGSVRCTGGVLAKARDPVCDSRDGPVRCTGGVLTTTEAPVLATASIGLEYAKAQCVARAGC